MNERIIIKLGKIESRNLRKFADLWVFLGVEVRAKTEILQVNFFLSFVCKVGHGLHWGHLETGHRITHLVTAIPLKIANNE